MSYLAGLDHQFAAFNPGFGQLLHQRSLPCYTVAGGPFVERGPWGWESSGVTKICGVSVRPGVGGDAERGVAVSTTVAAVPGVLFKGDGEGVGGGVGVGSGEYDGGGMAGDTGDGGQTRFVGGGDSELTGRTSRTSRNL